jgi:5-methylcytosine-specific restriction endonuclease McrBC regulatory subunit McrC
VHTTVKINHNYYEEAPIKESELSSAFNAKASSVRKDLFSSVYELTTKAETLKEIQLINFRKLRNQFDEEKLILKLYAKEFAGTTNYFIQTGLYAGVVFHKGYKFNITSKYGSAFLSRMLNFIDNVYVNEELSPVSKKEDVNEFQFILAYLFIQSLEKASVLGLPNEYQTQTQRGHKVRGKIDINEYLKREIPFRGKLTTTYREKAYVQEIVDVLYHALKKIEGKFGRDINKSLLGIYQVLKQNCSRSFVNLQIIHEAKNHKILNNSQFASFRKVLEYAEIILLNYDLSPSDNENSLETTGFLFDISQLFEIYLENLLSIHLENWIVESQMELSLYSEMFFKGHMYPDLILTNKNTGKVVVLDAKFKSMKLNGIDLDRTDFYQIHTYIQYFAPNVVMGGLIYPLSIEANKDIAHAQSLFGAKDREETKFIVDGIYLKDDMTLAQILESESGFIQRIKSVIE